MAANPFGGLPAAPSVALPLLRSPCRSFDCPAAPSVGEPIFLHSHSSLATPLVAYSGARSARKAPSRAPNRQICSRGPHPASSRAPSRQICSRDPHPASSRAPNRLICSRDPHPASSRAPNRLICSRGPPPRRSRAPNRQICSRDPPPSIPESVDESILSTYKFVIKPDVIRIAVLLTEVGEGIFTARSRVARFAVSLNE